MFSKITLFKIDIYLGYEDFSRVVKRNAELAFESNGKKLMQSQYEIHNLKMNQNQIHAKNIELEMELTKALGEIDKLKTILENHQDTASIKTVIFKKNSYNDSGVGSP